MAIIQVLVSDELEVFLTTTHPEIIEALEQLHEIKLDRGSKCTLHHILESDEQIPDGNYLQTWKYITDGMRYNMHAVSKTRLGRANGRKRVPKFAKQLAGQIRVVQVSVKVPT